MATISGKVEAGHVGGSSHFAHEAIYVQQGNQKVVIERQGGNPFEIDPTERALVGQNVKLKGLKVNSTLFRFTDVVSTSAPKVDKSPLQVSVDVKKVLDEAGLRNVFVTTGRDPKGDAIVIVEDKRAAGIYKALTGRPGAAGDKVQWITRDGVRVGIGTPKAWGFGLGG